MDTIEDFFYRKIARIYSYAGFINSTIRFPKQEICSLSENVFSSICIHFPQRYS